MLCTPNASATPERGYAFSREKSQTQGIILSKMVAAESFFVTLNMGNRLGSSQDMQLETQKKVGGEEEHRNYVG